jgi:hypothetical protein
MEGILDYINDNNWIVRYRTEDSNGLIIYKSVPVSRFNKIMYKNELYIDAQVSFEIKKENDHISHCECTHEQYHNCEFFVKSGINECMNFENIEVEVAKIITIAPKPLPDNEVFDRETVKNLLIEVKNRFAVMGNDNYNSDNLVIEWFERNYTLKK